MVILYPLYSFLDHEFWKHMKTCNKSDVIFVWTDTPPHGLVSQHKWHDFPIAPWRALGVAVLAPHIDPLHLKPVAQDLQKISFNAGDLSVDRSPAQMAQERAAIYWCFGMISNDIMWSCMTGHICASHHKREDCSRDFVLLFHHVQVTPTNDFGLTIANSVQPRRRHTRVGKLHVHHVTLFRNLMLLVNTCQYPF